MNIFGKSDIGLVRQTNQDSFSVGKIDDDIVWAVVCDGMGGASGGNVASSEAAKAIIERIKTLDISENIISNEELSSFMTDAVKHANTTVFEMAQNNVELSGMGTTCEFVFVINHRVHVAHVGDSRTYLIRNNRIIQITEDHSFVQEMVRQGQITQEEAEKHPNKNIITRAVGVGADVDVDYIETEFEQGDKILTCTDGLSNMVSAAEMLSIITENDGKTAVGKLVERAVSEGGYDNITVTAIY